MYKVSSDRRQSALSRGRLADWITNNDRPSIEEQLRQLREGVNIIDARISKASGEEKRELGRQKWAMQQELTLLRKKCGLERKTKDGLSQFVVDAAREMLSKIQFDMIYRAAERKYADALEIVNQQATGVANNPKGVPCPNSNPASAKQQTK